MDYSFFIDSEMKKSKYIIYTSENLPIEFKRNDEIKTIAQRFNICIEKHKTLNLIQIRLTSVSDESTIFVCTVDDQKFEKFKIEQSLYVTFEYFVKHITQMLDDCRQSKMNMLLTLATDHGYLQFYEKGTFKNLVHISLPIEKAPTEVILYYVNEAKVKLQEQNQLIIQKNSGLHMELLQKTEQLERMNETIIRMKTEMAEQEKLFVGRQREQIGRLELEFKHKNDSKDFQKQELEKQLTAFRAQIDTLVKENFTINDQLKKENKLTSQLRIENKNMKETIVTLKEQLKQMENDQISQKNVVQKNDHILNELRKQMQTTQEKIAFYEKQNTELMAELDAEKNICQIKRNSLKMATEDICSANAIIRKQSLEIAALKEKVDFRTELAFKQEQIIREKEQQTINLTNIIDTVGTSVKENVNQKHETETKIKWLQDQTDHLEQKYHNRIEELYKKIHTISKNANGVNRSRRSYERN